MNYWVAAFHIVAPLLLDIPSILLIYAIIWKSPSKMKFIRLFLLKMVICSMTAVHLLLGTVMPDFYQPQFPLPLVKINNNLFSGDALVAAIFISCCVTAQTFSSLGEECLIRFVLTYNIKFVLKLGHEVIFIFIVIIEIIIASILGALVAFQSMDGNASALAQFIQNHNATYMLNDFDLDKDTLIFFSPDSPTFWPLAILLVFIILGLYVTITGLTYLTHWKIARSAGMMSSENFALQKRLTKMLFLQIGLPNVVLGLPLGVMGLGYAAVFLQVDADTRYRDIYGHFSWAYPVFGGLVFTYPCLNSVFTIIIIKPYKTAILELFGIGCNSCCRVRALPSVMSRDNRKLRQEARPVIMIKTIGNTH